MTNINKAVQEWRETIDNPNAVVSEIRTVKQNKCLHDALDHLAGEFNAAGLDMKKVLKPAVDIPWTKESAKEFLFNPIAAVMFDGKTSSQLTTTEISEVWEVLMRHTGEKHGVTVPWPDRFNRGGRED